MMERACSHSSTKDAPMAFSARSTGDIRRSRGTVEMSMARTLSSSMARPVSGTCHTTCAPAAAMLAAARHSNCAPAVSRRLTSARSRCTTGASPRTPQAAQTPAQWRSSRDVMRLMEPTSHAPVKVNTCSCAQVCARPVPSGVPRANAPSVLAAAGAQISPGSCAPAWASGSGRW